MVVDSPPVETLTTLFVDEDGRLQPVVRAVTELDEPIETASVDSLQAATDFAADRHVDCVVVLDAPEVGDQAEVDGVHNYEQAQTVLPEIPLVVYSLDCDHPQLQRLIDIGAPVISTTPNRPELIYRQLRNAAGMERHFQSDAELLKSLFEYYPHHIFLKDETGRFEGVSDATAREYGFTRQELKGLTDYEMLDPQTAHENYLEEQALLDSKEPTVNRIDHWVDDDGRDRWMSITKAPRYDDDGNPVGIVGSSRDVTEGKRKEQMVRELYEASRELVRAESKSDIAESAMSLTSDIPVFSHIQVALVDEATGDLEPVTPLEDGRKSLFERYEQCFEQAAETRTSQYVVPGEGAIERPSQASDLEAAVLPLAEHGALGLAADADSFTAFGIDLAKILSSNLEAALDRAERERELARQNERLEEFASIVSHDLRNPLNVASAATELVAEDGDLDNVERIRNALDRMDRLIEALLTLARKGQVVGETEFVTVEGAARDAWKVVDSPHATLNIESSGVLAADSHRLIEMFENLFRNAIEHGGEEVTVTVGLREQADGFYVSDDGSGIDPEIQDKLFEMGYSTEATGTGYGLYIVSTIADAHGWSIEATNTDKGGARFDITGTVVEAESAKQSLE